MNSEPLRLKKAILAGIINPPESGLPPLTFAEQDAKDMAERLERFGFKTVFVPSNEATRDRLERESRCCKKEQGDLLLFFLSAHGQLIDGSLHLHPVDSNAEGDKTLVFSTLYNMWKNQFGYKKVLVILDTCRSGLVPKGAKGAATCSEDVVKDVKKATESDRCIEVIYGCGEGEYSYEVKELGHGLLTNCMLAVLDEIPDYLDSERLAGDTNDRIRKWCKAHPEKGFKQTAHRYHVPTLEQKIVLVDRSEEAWQKSISADAIDVYLTYQRNFPDSAHNIEASKAIRRLRENEAWSEAGREDTSEAYKHYLKQFAEGVHAAEANQLKELRFREEQEWARTRATDSIAAFQHFAQEYPASRKRPESEQRLKELREDDQAWENAVATGNYGSYLDSRPEGKHRRDACRKLEEAFAQTQAEWRLREKELTALRVDAANADTSICERDRQASARDAGVGTADADRRKPEWTRRKSLVSVTKDWPRINSLGMRFLPVQGTNLLFCVWETRVQDYEIFVKETDFEWQRTSFKQEPSHPAVKVSWEDASCFCKWLTDKERNGGWIGSNLVYRLPTDLEWSAAVGLPKEGGATPEDRNMSIKNHYPWATEWPPPQGAGNYADMTSKNKYPDRCFIADYDDGFAETSPVGSFNPNRHGLFDMGGNVWEWCEEWFDSQQRYRVLRGASWINFDPFYTLSSCRHCGNPDDRYDHIGFRVVLGANGSSPQTGGC